MAFGGFLKESTAVTVKLGPFLDDTDGKTAETGLSIAAATVRLSKNGGNFAAKNSTSALTHDELGHYDCPLDATDTGIDGILRIAVHTTGALPISMDYVVMQQNPYDALTGASDRLQVDVREIDSQPNAAAFISRQNRGAYAQGAYGTAQTGTTTGLTLVATATTDDDIFINRTVFIAQYTGQGQARRITDYDGTSKVATISRAWDVVPNSTSRYVILPTAEVDTDSTIVNANVEQLDGNANAATALEEYWEGVYNDAATAQTGTTTGITFAAAATSSDDWYNDELVFLIRGTGVGQSRRIIDYDGTSKVATVDRAWGVNPDSSTVYLVVPAGPVNVSHIEGSDATDQILDAVVDDSTQIDASHVNSLGYEVRGAVSYNSSDNSMEVACGLYFSGLVQNASSCAITVYDYDGDSVIATGDWDTGPTEDTTTYTWSAKKNDASSDIAAGHVYFVRIVFNATYYHDVFLNTAS